MKLFASRTSSSHSNRVVNESTQSQQQKYFVKTPYTTPFLPSNSQSASPQRQVTQTIQTMQTVKKMPNYFKLKTQPSEQTLPNVLFKTGFELQEELKVVKKENQEMKAYIDQLKEELDRFIEFQEVFVENKKLKDVIAQLQIRNMELIDENEKIKVESQQKKRN
ncbi:hypothetical protein pb186bvf_003621 [Paramecium bursaria]